MWTRTEAAARTRSDADYAFLSTAHGRRREIVRKRTEAAARTRSDVDSLDCAFLSTAPGRRREIARTRTRTWTCAWACFKTGQNGDSRRTPPCPPPDIILSFPSPSPQSALNAHRLMSRGMMMGLPVKASGPPAEKSLPAACRQGHWNHSRCCPDVAKNSSGTQRHCLAAGTPSTHCHASRRVLPRRW